MLIPRPSRSKLSVLGLFVLVLLASTSTLSAQLPNRFRRAVSAHRIPGQYIVILRRDTVGDAVPLIAQELAVRHAGRVRVLLQYAARGFTVDLTEPQAILLSRDPRVLVVEENSRAYLASVQELPGDNSLWHLDRIDQRTSIASGDDLYRYCERASGVIAYVLDTGINREHDEFQISNGFGSRVLNGVKFALDHHVRPGEADDYGTFPCGGWHPGPGSSAGHGTAVASIIGGRHVGVAKEVRLVPLRVADCDFFGNASFASVEHLCWALDWIRSPSNPNRDHRPALVNISLRVPVPLPPQETPYLEAALESVIKWAGAG